LAASAVFEGADALPQDLRLVLLLRANDLCFGAGSAKSVNLGPWGTEV
jgi:hypothetical protein